MKSIIALAVTWAAVVSVGCMAPEPEDNEGSGVPGPDLAPLWSAGIRWQEADDDES